MEKNKTEQYTFGADEKETLQRMATFEASVGQNIQKKNQRELIATKYYSEFVINTQKGTVTLNNVFITVEKDQQGQLSYHFRWISENEKGQQTVEENLVIDENGKAHATGGLKEYFGDEEIDIEKLMAENDIEQGRLKGISEKAEPKEIEKTMKKQAEKENSDEQKEEEKEEPEEQIEKDLSGEEDLEISYYRKIEDGNLDEQMKKDFSGYEEKGIAYSKAKNAFIMVGKKDGKFQMVDGFEPAKPTYKTVMSIDEKGKTVEKKVPHALMKTNNPKKEMSITIGQYGYIEAGTVDRLPCDRRIEMQVQETGETSAGRTERTLASAIRAEGSEGLHNWAHEHEEMLEKMEKGEITDTEDLEEEISNGGEHIYTEDEEKLIENAAKNRAHMSVEGFKEILKGVPENEDIGKRINDAVEVAEEQARGSIEY